ncbi:hypothetical protein Tco_0668228 [Tanacetum coccineum]
MRPFALKQTRRPRSDREKACHSVSSTFAHHYRGSSSHQDEDDEYDGASRPSTPSPTTYLNSLESTQLPTIRIPSLSEQVMISPFERKPNCINQMQRSIKEVRRWINHSEAWRSLRQEKEVKMLSDD